jgi:hypothetical protein
VRYYDAVELRVVVWDTRNVLPSDSLTQQSDIGLSGHLLSVGGKDREPVMLKEETDVHWRAKEGRAVFNWRMVFELELDGDDNTDGSVQETVSQTCPPRVSRRRRPAPTRYHV